jgi:hypothetical protein
MTPTLTTLERAMRNCSGASTADERTIALLLAGVSEAIRRYCGRNLFLAHHDEVIPGQEEPCLVLREYPVRAIEAVRFNPSVVLRIRNTDPANQIARVVVTETHLELLRVASGIKSVATLPWASNLTLLALASAVNALGHGWTASSVEPYSLWPSRDLPILGLSPTQGAKNARAVTVGLLMHVSELSGYCWDGLGRIYRRDPQADLLQQSWAGSADAWRVQYTAGYEQIPEDLQEACSQWVAERFAQTKRDPGLASQSVVGSLMQTWPHVAQGPPPRVRAILSLYRRYCVG